jgi:RNA polymerase sigma-70 factor (ECF subfamily)
MPEPTKDVAGWLPAACAGSSEAVAQLLEACRGYLLMVAWEKLDADLQAKGGASDLVQETFLAAHQHFDQFRGTTEAELLGWLRQTLLHKLAKFRKRFRQTQKRQLGAEVPLADSDSTTGRAPVPVDTGSSPSAQVRRDEEAAVVRGALERLPEDYRRVILLRIHEGLPFDEIGRRMGRSPNAAEKLFARSVRAVRQELETPP